MKIINIVNVVLDLNKGGYIDNNNVESSWNNTFKEFWWRLVKILKLVI